MINGLVDKLKENSTSPEIIDWALSSLKENIEENSYEFLHSLRAALILKGMSAKDETIAAAILQNIPVNVIKNEAYKETFLVLRKLKTLRTVFGLKKALEKKPIKKWPKVVLDAQAENLRKMFFVLGQDLRPVFVMLALILDEMRDLDHFQKDIRAQKALEALEIFAPLAYSLGALSIKGELEDLAFPQLYFKEHEWLEKNVKEKYGEREQLAQNMKPVIADRLKSENVSFLEIVARGKHYFSLYQKLLKHNMDIDKIYDLVALRIIVETTDDCYKALGAIHKSFQPLDGRIKDYISVPKKNGYRALHTTVYCQQCQMPIEIQIKTPEMHKEAEYGAWAHFAYKAQDIPQNYWMNMLRKWKEEAQDPQGLSDFLKNEVFKDKIFVFTPKREIIELPKNATPVDFAYAVHSDVGEHCKGARINGKMAPLNRKLNTGEIIEILTSKNKLPSFDWLRFVKTQKAKAKIRNFLEGTKGISLKPETKPLPVPLEKKPSLKDRLSFFTKIIPSRKKEEIILIGGQKGIAFKIAKCCQPKTGDDIVAFITKGEGASLHKKDCANFKRTQEKWPMRITNATWFEANVLASKG